jgi:hypothetical protein
MQSEALVPVEFPPTRSYGLEGFWNAQERIIEDVTEERIRQNVKWRCERLTSGCHPVSEWSMILGEEAGETQQAMSDLWFRKDDTQRHALVAHLREELVQVAAVCFAVIERIDDNDPHILQRRHS